MQQAKLVFFCLLSLLEQHHPVPARRGEGLDFVMSINNDQDLESPEHFSATRRGRGGSHGSKYSKFSDSKEVPLLLEESFSSIESSGVSEMQPYAQEYSYISTVSLSLNHTLSQYLTPSGELS